jgi:Domain of unknown function (DUF4194)
MSAFGQLTEVEQEQLREALTRLLSSGGILRDEPGQRDLYEWCRVHRTMLDELAGLLGMRVHWEHESRFIQAVPLSARLRLGLKQDETLIVLALWYDFHHAVSDDGKALQEVYFTVREFNEQLATKFKDLKLPGITRLREILQVCERKNLIRLQHTADFADTTIQVLPTIRHVIPFPGIEEWQRTRDRHVQAGATEPATEPTTEDNVS